MKYNRIEAQNVAKKYKYKIDFIENDKGYYRYAHREGILDEICSHMKQKQKSPKYTKDMVYKELEKYEFFDEFIKGSYPLYKFAFREGMLDEVEKILNKRCNIKWTKEKVLQEAKKYKSRSEFCKSSRGAYERAYKDNYLDEACSHMEKIILFGNKSKLYKDRKTILYYVKINNLWKIGVAIHERYKKPEDTILKQRYGNYIKQGVKVEIVDYNVYENGEYAYLNEQEILEMYTENKYMGEKFIFSGETEMYTENIYDEIRRYFK